MRPLAPVFAPSSERRALLGVLMFRGGVHVVRQGALVFVVGVG